MSLYYLGTCHFCLIAHNDYTFAHTHSVYMNAHLSLCAMCPLRNMLHSTIRKNIFCILFKCMCILYCIYCILCITVMFLLCGGCMVHHLFVCIGWALGGGGCCSTRVSLVHVQMTIKYLLTYLLCTCVVYVCDTHQNVAVG